MSSATKTDASNGSSTKTAVTVEQFIEYLQTSGQPIKSITVIHDVEAGMIIGGAGDIDHEQELAQGVTYIVIGLGRLPVSDFDPGITFLED